jgi:hypothetical protein
MCACVIATTDAGGDFSAVTDCIENSENVSLIGLSAASANSTSLPLWYLDEDNNFKLV